MRIEKMVFFDVGAGVHKFFRHGGFYSRCLLRISMPFVFPGLAVLEEPTLKLYCYGWRNATSAPRFFGGFARLQPIFGLAFLEKSSVFNGWASCLAGEKFDREPRFFYEHRRYVFTQ
jgi:hypothetical protein